MEKKYELVKDDSIIIGSSWLYRIRALKNIQTSALGIRSGDLGGYVESEKKFIPRWNMLGTWQCNGIRRSYCV